MYSNTHTHTPVWFTCSDCCWPRDRPTILILVRLPSVTLVPASTDLEWENMREWREEAEGGEREKEREREQRGWWCLGGTEENKGN